MHGIGGVAQRSCCCNKDSTMFVRRVESAFLIGVKLARRAGSEARLGATSSSEQRGGSQANECRVGLLRSVARSKARRQEGAVVIRRIVQRERKPKGGGGQECWCWTEARGDLHGQPRAGDAHL